MTGFFATGSYYFISTHRALAVMVTENSALSGGRLTIVAGQVRSRHNGVVWYITPFTIA